jgi:hypothetical protein
VAVSGIVILSRLIGPVSPHRVWFVQEAGRLLIRAGANSGKVKGIRRNPRVTIAPYPATGRLRAQPVLALADLLPAAELGRGQGANGGEVPDRPHHQAPPLTTGRLAPRPAPAKEVAVAIIP